MFHLLTCRMGWRMGGYPGSASLSLGCGELSLPPPLHISLQTTLPSECCVSDAQGCSSYMVVQLLSAHPS